MFFFPQEGHVRGSWGLASSYGNIFTSGKAPRISLLGVKSEDAEEAELMPVRKLA